MLFFLCTDNRNKGLLFATAINTAILKTQRLSVCSNIVRLKI